MPTIEAYLGEVRIFGGDRIPAGWAKCEGQVMSITEHTALFAVLGTKFGGDGTTTFALPDLRDRTPTHMIAVEGVFPG
ncbi:MAG TPA: tail fiber protein [Actinomycetota bacterium]|nr:tail fiber protein [Actinomycetota bacterium]